MRVRITHGRLQRSLLNEEYAISRTNSAVHIGRIGISTTMALLTLPSCAVSQQQEVELGASTAAQVSAQLPQYTKDLL
jgi:hypothetical protein